MAWAQLIVISGLCLINGPDDPAALVEQLGASRYAERQEALETLESMGAAALPALRAARQSADAEVRTRAIDLIGRIESDLLIKPTTVRLDFDNQPITDVVAALSDRTGIPMALLPENNPGWKSRRVTLRESEAQTFWQMLDRLCAVGELRPMIAMGGGLPGRESAVQLFSGIVADERPVHLNGPFRISAEGIHYHLDRSFATGGTNPVLRHDGVVVRQEGNQVSRQFYFDLKVEVEPRLLLTGNGDLELTEAVDDQGNSLLLDQGAGAVIRNSGYFGVGRTTTAIQLQAHLRFPDRTDSTISRLRGKLPVVIAARRDDPLIVDLTMAKGKTFETRDVELEVLDIRAEGDQPGTTIDLSLRPLAPLDPTVAGAVANPLGVELMAFRNPNTPQSQIEILDAQGRSYRQWFPSSTNINQEQARVSLTLQNPNNELGPPATLRYYDMNRVESVVEFEFRDVPMF